MLEFQQVVIDSLNSVYSLNSETLGMFVGMNVFQFMGSGSSSERPTQHIARKVAEDIIRTKKQGGKIVLVGGPAIVHTGAADAVAKLAS